MFSLHRPAGLLLAMNLLLSGLAAYRAARPASRAAPVELAPRPVVPLEGTLVHLLRGEGDTFERHAAVQLDAEVGDERDRAVIVARMTPLREAVLSYFSDRTAAELKAPGSLDRLKRELLPRLNHRLPGPHIRALYVTQFVVQ